MAQDRNNGILDGLKTGRSLYNIADKFGLLSTAPETVSLGGSFGPTAGMAGGNPGLAAASNGLSSAVGMLPFGAVAALVVPKLIEGFFGAKPSVSFSGVDPKYVADGGSGIPNAFNQFHGRFGGTKSSKYEYSISVKDTGSDDEIAKEMVKSFDAIFDKLAERGVPVDELLARNKEFVFGQGIDSEQSINQLVQKVMQHYSPDIEAYSTGQAPPDRTISINPTSRDKASGREKSDTGRTSTKYMATLTNDGVQTSPEGMTAYERVTNPNLTAEQRAEGYGSLDDVYAEAMAGGKGKNSKYQIYLDLLKNGGRDLQESYTNAPEWWKEYAKNRNQITTSPTGEGEAVAATNEYIIPEENDRTIANGDLGNDAPVVLGGAQPAANNESFDWQEFISGSNNPSSLAAIDRRVWNDLVNRFYAEDGNVEGLVNAEADHVRGAAEDYQKGVQAAQTKNQSVLDSIISGIQSGKGQYAPIGFKVNGMPVNLGISKGQRNTLGQLAELSNKSYANQTDALKNILNVSTLTSPSSGALQYITMLGALADAEEARRKNDVTADLKAEELANGLAIGHRRLDQGEPGFVDYLEGVDTALDLGGSIWDTIGGIFG